MLSSSLGNMLRRKKNVFGGTEILYWPAMKTDGQVIIISFTDNIVFELVPAFINTDDSIKPIRKRQKH